MTILKIPMLDAIVIKFRHLLRQSENAIYIIHIFRMLNTSYRNFNKSQRSKLESFSQSVNNLMKVPLGDGQKGLAVIFGWSQFELILSETAIRKGLELQGYNITVLSQPTPFVQDAYNLMGIEKVKSFYSYCPSPSLAQAEEMMNGVDTFEDFIALRYKGINVGKYASSTIMRQTRRGTLNFNDPLQKKLAKDSLSRSLSAAQGALLLIKETNPSILVVVDRGYTPYGEMFDACVNENVAVITWNVAHRDNALILKRYYSKNRDSHPASLSSQSWQTMLDLKWTDEHRQKLHNELSSSYANGEWYGEVGTQFGKKEFGASEIISRYGFDSNKKIAVIFSHIFWDATFFWGKDLFRDYEDWFVQTVKAACENTKLNWLIKVHPANTVKDHRDGLISEPSELIALREQIGELPEHVKVINADTPISTWSLFEAMDYCLTVRGTVGIEAAMLGKTVLTAGTGRYDSHGFTHDFTSASNYLECLKHLEDLEQPTSETKEKAERYAYGIFISRPLRLKTFTLGFSRDKKASMLVNCSVKTIDELQNADDLNQISNWISSTTDDYLNYK
jgi:hypothetical protein